jgi:hypothetical protein
VLTAVLLFDPRDDRETQVFAIGAGRHLDATGRFTGRKIAFQLQNDPLPLTLSFDPMRK